MEEKKEFDELFRQYYQELYFFAMQFLHNEEDSRDVVSDAFEDVWVNFASLQRKTVRYYLYKDVRNKCIDLLRRISTRQQYAALYKKVTSIYVRDNDMVEAEEREQKVKQVLDSLKSPTREIFTACYVEQKKYAEVAETMGISTETVKKHVMRALKFIKEKRQKAKDDW